MKNAQAKPAPKIFTRVVYVDESDALDIADDPPPRQSQS